MLILTRKKGESLIIDGKIEIKIMSSEDGKVRIGIDAPREIEIHRQEVYDQILEENKKASGDDKADQLKALMAKKKNI